MPVAPELTWFAICVSFRSEYRVCESLTEARFERYCPSERKFVTHARKRTPKSFPLFPGYVFVGLEPVDHGPRGPEFPFDAIQGLEGVISFVAFGDRPRPMSYEANQDSIRSGARSLSEIRAMEETGCFDHTLNAKAAANVRKARKTLKGFDGLADAMAQKAA